MFAKKIPRVKAESFDFLKRVAAALLPDFSAILKLAF